MKIFDKTRLQQTLDRIDGKGYKAYKDIEGSYKVGGFILYIDHVQGDPFAAPSRVRVSLDQEKAGFPEFTYTSSARATGVANHLAKAFAAEAKKVSVSLGSGGSGRIDIDRPGQQVLPITAVHLNEQGVETRFYVGMPAQGRKILGRQAARILLEIIPDIVNKTLKYESYKEDILKEVAETNEDADWLREKLSEEGLIGFVANGSILPRRSGVDDRPLEEEKAIKFRSPESLETAFELPNRGRITGMGVPAGVNLIVGGGYHGKSTLLNALEKGVYNHCPGDGREFVISAGNGAKIRAEDGRSVTNVNISPFINNLPFGRSTETFSSDNASGSTSQAVNIMEALEVGTDLLMIDEDTSATNFMIRDRRMQRLIAKQGEPITPFIDKVRHLYDSLGVSTLLVIGGSGDYLDVADTVIAMKDYGPQDVTSEAKKVVEEIHTGRVNEGDESFGEQPKRSPDPASIISPRDKKAKLKALGREGITINKERVDLSAVEQIVDSSQTWAISEAIMYIWKNYMNSDMSISQIVKQVKKDIEEKGLDALNPMKLGDLADVREHELAAALNRIRNLRIKH